MLEVVVSVVSVSVGGGGGGCFVSSCRWFMFDGLVLTACTGVGLVLKRMTNSVHLYY
jgi:hypothetical protein